MAKYAFHDCIKCECGSKMFPCNIDKSKQEVTYKCWMKTCGKMKVLSFDDASLKDDRIKYLALS